jgi:hypothetical protein
VDLFGCAGCDAVPEQLTEGKARVTVVQHRLGCPTLLAVVRARWPLAPGGLPASESAVPFEKWASTDRYGRLVKREAVKQQAAADRPLFGSPARIVGAGAYPQEPGVPVGT